MHPGLNSWNLRQSTGNRSRRRSSLDGHLRRGVFGQERKPLCLIDGEMDMGGVWVHLFVDMDQTRTQTDGAGTGYRGNKGYRRIRPGKQGGGSPVIGN